MKPSLSEPERVPLAGSLSGPTEVGRETPRSANMKFLYPSGANPLDGYTIKRGVGRGGFGEVYFATSDAGKEVALKLIRRNLDVELRGVRHCLNLKHHNLIGLYDIRTDDLDDQWVVMEYVSGQSLEDVIDAHPKGMPIEQVLWWIRSISAGVGYLHDHGIVHRDLKPGNIFLDHDGYSTSGQSGTVKIGDYGLSKFISCSRRSGQTESVGTVHYMAPEIANGRYGREIDTYALGVVLYEMLTGHVPFEGESVGEVLMKHLTAEPDLDRVPEPFREIIRRALAKDPDVRLSSVNELVAMLPGEPTAPQGSSAAQAAYQPSPEVTDTGEFERFAGYDDDPKRHRSGQYATHQQPVVVEEPMYVAFRDFRHGLWKQFNESNAPPVLQGLILTGIVIALMFTIGVWTPMLIGLGIFYAVYYVIWSVLLKPGVKARAQRDATSRLVSQPPPEPTVEKPRRHPLKRQRAKPWREVVHRQLAAKTKRERVTELLGAMLMSGVLCVLASFIVAAVVSSNTPGGDWEVMNLWFAIVSTLGCWGVLLTNKLTEARVEDQAPMRSILLGFGALVGILAFALTNGLAFDLPINRDLGPGPNNAIISDAFNTHNDMMPGWQNNAVAPSFLVSTVYFAFLFAIPRWWRVAEFTRDKRLSLWSVLGLVIWAWVLHILWWYPQPIGMAVAATVAIVTQLSSPWFPPSKRVELARQRAAI